MVVAIIQARMSSSRLPGKVLLPLGNKNSILHIVERLSTASLVDKIVVATSEQKENDVIAHYCDDIDCDCFRGSENDVLWRVADCAKKYKADAIVEVTADCPLVDPDWIDALVDIFYQGYDYVSNIIERTWPDGADIQVYTRKVLGQVDSLNILTQHRSHAGWNVVHYRDEIERIYNTHLKFHNVFAPPDFYLPDIGLTLDTAEDLELLDKVFSYFDCNTFSIEEAIDYVIDNNLHKINMKVQRKIPGEG